MEEVAEAEALTKLESLSLHASRLRQSLARCTNYVAYWTQGSAASGSQSAVGRTAEAPWGILPTRATDS